MPDKPVLNHPWLVAVWPGMGNVAVSAGYYLMAKLEMHQLAEFSARELFDLDHIEVKGGLIRSGRLPRSCFYVWNDPRQNHDLIVFIGEAQPPSGKYAFCRQLIDFARELGVEKMFTFAAMATGMRPGHESRVFGAAVDKETLNELRHLELEILEDGRIGGLNGVLLGLAAELHIPGACLLGEIPHLFSQLPFPKASLAVLGVFCAMARIDLDLTELAVEAESMDKQLGGLLSRIETAIEQQNRESEDATRPSWETPPEAPPEALAGKSKRDRLSAKDRKKIELLFEQAESDRSKAYELKAELDRLRVFQEFEDRFLGLFQKPG